MPGARHFQRHLLQLAKQVRRPGSKRLKELEAENSKPKRLLADKLLEVDAMKDVLSKKW